MVLEYFVRKNKRSSGFCSVHNKSNVEGFREAVLKSLCKCITEEQYMEVICIQEPPNLLKEPEIKDWGSRTCDKFRKSKKCDFCSHIIVTDHFLNKHENQKHRIHGHLRHDYAPEGKIRWFIYIILDTSCLMHYVGSTSKLLPRWANHKHEINTKDPQNCSTALSRHFISGCPGDISKKKEHLKIILVDYHDTTIEKLMACGHKDGPGCKCEECITLKTIEVDSMLQTNSISIQYGLNSMDEVIFITQSNFATKRKL